MKPVVFGLTVLALAAIPYGGAAAESAADECHARASSPYEPENLGTQGGIEMRDMDGWLAIFSCREALDADPKSPELFYRTGRAYHAHYGPGANSMGPAATAYYERAAEYGYAPAQHDLATILKNGTEDLARDTAGALRWFGKAAEQGFAPSQLALGRIYTEGDVVPQDFSAGAQWLMKAAEQGLTEAQFAIGQAYEAGRGIHLDHKEASAWYRRAAENGHSDAQFSLGRFYLEGLGVPRDAREARLWFERAALRGNLEASENLEALVTPQERSRWHDQLLRGLRQALGDGVPQDPAGGAALIADAAEAGSVDAQFTLGTLYAGGHGVAQDEEKAKFWFEAAAHRGYAPAQTILGEMIFDAANSIDRWDEGRNWLIKAAEQGDPYAQYRLGKAYIAGVDGEFWRHDEAVKWYARSAEQGFVPAQAALALRYWNGDFRTDTMPQDRQKAVHWFRIAAGHGNPMAQTYLGYAYAQGEGGLPKDEKAAVELWLRAAERNYARAEEALAWAYDNGVGVSQSSWQARSWYERAASHGSEGAQRALESPEMASVAHQETGVMILTAVLAVMIATAGNPSAETGEVVGSTMYTQTFGYQQAQSIGNDGIMMGP